MLMILALCLLLGSVFVFCCLLYTSATGKVSYAFQPRIPGYYHGTGDVFGSALLAALLRDRSLEEASAIAVDYTQRTIAMTAQLGQEARYGVCFECTLPYLLERLA